MEGGAYVKPESEGRGQFNWSIELSWKVRSVFGRESGQIMRYVIKQITSMTRK